MAEIKKFLRIIVIWALGHLKNLTPPVPGDGMIKPPISPYPYKMRNNYDEKMVEPIMESRKTGLVDGIVKLAQISKPLDPGPPKTILLPMRP